MKVLFKENNKWFMELTTPDYERDNFGMKVGELRIANETQAVGSNDDPFLSKLLVDSGIQMCTFRGKEDTTLVQYLNKQEFKFIGTFYSLGLTQSDFRETSLCHPEWVVEEATELEYGRVCSIEKEVFDFSTYQMDNRIMSEFSSRRNVKRVQTYFTKPNHHTFVIKEGGIILGFIQFVYENDMAMAVNGAIHPSHHKKFLGTMMYNEAFKAIFDSGIRVITSGVSAQNVKALRIHQSCGFKIIDAEIHLRWIEK